MKTTHVTARQKCWYDNVANILLSVEEISGQDDPEKELITVLKQKYDALKDKILMEVSTFAITSFHHRYVNVV